jgi:hypothetical protein
MGIVNDGDKDKKFLLAKTEIEDMHYELKAIDLSSITAQYAMVFENI